MIFKNFILIIIVNVLFACGVNKSDKSIVGKYKSKEYGYMSELIMGMKKESYIHNSTLALAADSTYILNNCGNTIKGNWKITGDTLLLICLENKYDNDSLNKVRPPLSCGKKPQKFKIVYTEPIELQEELSIKNNKVLNTLVKTEN